MWRRLSTVAGLTLLFGTLVAPAARADTRFDIRIGVPGPPMVAYMPPPAYGGYIWQPGYYVWAGYRRIWVPGAWVRPGYVYGRPRWNGVRRFDHRWDRGRR